MRCEAEEEEEEEEEDDDDMFDGPQVAYYYPDHETTLVGRFSGGLAACAHLGTAEEARLLTSSPLAELYKSHGRHPCGCVRLGSETRVFRGQEPSATSLGLDTLVPDPYEAARVTDGRSTIDDAAEGLFARRALAAGELVSFYSGLRISHADVDARDWDLNDNTITLDDTTVIDVRLWR